MSKIIRPFISDVEKVKTDLTNSINSIILESKVPYYFLTTLFDNFAKQVHTIAEQELENAEKYIKEQERAQGQANVIEQSELTTKQDNQVVADTTEAAEQAQQLSPDIAQQLNEVLAQYMPAQQQEQSQEQPQELPAETPLAQAAAKAQRFPYTTDNKTGRPVITAN
jgi:hypothetical protein